MEHDETEEESESECETEEFLCRMFNGQCCCHYAESMNWKQAA